MATSRHWPEELGPRQLLFFSADVVGSTQLKQTKILNPDGTVAPDDEEPWLDVIQDFYIGINECVADEFARVMELYETYPYQPPYIKNMAEPRLWKTIGDEVLFWVEITDSRQLDIYLRIWMNVVWEITEFFGNKYKKRKPTWKCTAWMAHFPWRNKMIINFGGPMKRINDSLNDTNLFNMKRYFGRKTPPPGAILDFVGPGIDLGFRLSAKSTARRFTISADIAYMLAQIALAPKRTKDPICESNLLVPAPLAMPTTRRAPNGDSTVCGQRIHFDELTTLKGVHGGQGYPHFWIDMASSRPIDDYRRDLEGRTPCSVDGIKKFALAFYKERADYVYPPFIVSDTEEILTKRPDWYDDRHEDMLKRAGYQCFPPA